MTVGFFGGKFLPLHQGHVNCIIKASGMCDILYVGVSHSDDDMELFDGKMKPITLEKRMQFVSQIASQLPNVKVISFKQKNTMDILDWKDGASIIRNTIMKQIDFVFSSEDSYGAFFDNLYPNSKHVLLDIDRDEFPIYATDIRRDGAFKHWNYIPNVCKSYYNKKVVIIGTESCGKSTLVKKLALHYNTNYVAEYGRDMCELLNTGQPTKEYYPYIAYGHKTKEFNAILNSNKILFVDTEATVTQFYSELYADKTYAVLEEIVKTNDYDLFILLDIDVPWVNDGLRIHGWERQRIDNHKKLIVLLEKYGVEYKLVKGSYNERYLKSVELVDELLS